jgi:phosphate transport system permease protein
LNAKDNFKKEYLGRGIVTICGFGIILLTLSIGAFLFYKGIATFVVHKHSIFEFLFSSDWDPASIGDGGTVGAAIFIVGSIVISTLAILISTPFSIAAALFVTEISPNLGKKILQPVIEIFVGNPSVVYGWVGLCTLVPFIAKVFDLPYGFSVLAGSIVLAVMIFPTITSMPVDAIASVEKEYKDASYALGSTRWQMITKIILPAAIPGILTGIVLGLARAFGEALAVSMVIGKMQAFPTSIFLRRQTLPRLLRRIWATPQPVLNGMTHCGSCIIIIDYLIPLHYSDPPNRKKEGSNIMNKTNRYAKFADKTATVVLYMVAGFFLLLLAAFTIYIMYHGVKAFDWDYMGFDREGIGVQLFNTVYLVFISLLISVPVGVAAGIYISEYAKENALTRFLRICIETLSSLPSIVVGMFGYLVFLVMTGSHWNLLAGALAISILNIPQMTTVTKDALQNVPEIYREGSYGLGATHWQTIWNMMLPAVMPRIITGIIIFAGRGFGEAAHCCLLRV